MRMLPIMNMISINAMLTMLLTMTNMTMNLVTMMSMMMLLMTTRMEGWMEPSIDRRTDGW